MTIILAAEFGTDYDALLTISSSLKLPHKWSTMTYSPSIASAAGNGV
jgi:hypothetical protein